MHAALNLICYDDYQCANTHGCENGKCVKYYSRPNGTPTTNAMYCASTYINTITENNTSKVICDQVTRIKEDCTVDTDICDFKWEVGRNVFALYPTTCQCNFSETELRFCPDVPPLAKQWIVETAHTSRRFYNPGFEMPSPYPQCILNSINGASVEYLKSKVVLIIFALLFILV